MAKAQKKKSSQKQNSQSQAGVWSNPLAKAPASFLAQKNSAVNSEMLIQGRLFVIGHADLKKVGAKIEKFALPAARVQLIQDLGEGKDVLQFMSMDGPVWVIAQKAKSKEVSHSGVLEESDYSWHRDRVGAWMVANRMASHLKLDVTFENCSKDSILGALVGIELAMYSYKNIATNQVFAKAPRLEIHGLKNQKETLVAAAQAKAQALNLARHLVNTPPNLMNPQTMEDFIKSHFTQRKGVKVEVWDEKKLRSENMGLILGVGSGSATPPRLIHIRYRPSSAKKNTAPIAFVGKGITFDTGGLDIKPSSGMRLMKKDMGGSATIVGLADWATSTNYPKPLDFYLAMAENSVDERAFRPSDVLVSRAGIAVEIHNTDAEGRLVLADALDVAVTQSGDDEPSMVIDVATLTGAIKTALGTEIGGLFSNHDPLAASLEKACSEAGDLAWRMPLYNKYTNGFNSAFADVVNAVDGWAGPITAALFLEKFTRRKPWAHFDVYCWNDRAEGPYSFAGGNAQTAQALIRFLENSATKR